MHSYEEYRQILELWEKTKNKKRIGVITGINRTTVRECINRFGTIAGLDEYRESHPDIPQNFLVLNSGYDLGYEGLFAAYSYLLGVYLGDGTITQHPRAYKLRIVCDLQYPRLIEIIIQAINIWYRHPT